MKKLETVLKLLLLVLVSSFALPSCGDDDDKADDLTSYDLVGEWVGFNQSQTQIMAMICDYSSIEVGLYYTDEAVTTIGEWYGTYSYYPNRKLLVATWDNSLTDEFTITNLKSDSFTLSLSSGQSYSMKRYVESTTETTGSSASYAPYSLAGQGIYINLGANSYTIYFNNDGSCDTSKSKCRIGDVTDASYTRTGNNTARLSVTYKGTYKSDTINWTLTFTSATAGEGAKDGDYGGGAYYSFKLL